MSREASAAVLYCVRCERVLIRTGVLSVRNPSIPFVITRALRGRRVRCVCGHVSAIRRLKANTP